MQKYLIQTETELKIRNYSPKTIRSYLLCLKEYFNYIQTDFYKPNSDFIRTFLLRKQERGYAPQTINLYLNAIKFFYREIIKSNEDIGLKFAKRTKKLPVVLSRDEITKILDVIKNHKHRIIISLAYVGGLRVSEIVSLKVKDINLEELTIHIKQGKGKRDRITVFPEKLKTDIQNMTAGKDMNEYIFTSGQGEKLKERTSQKIFKNALRRSRINKEATFHSLRHSFATHLLEKGTDIRYIQALLGHQNIRTTQIYTKVTNPAIKNIKSPF